MVELRHQKAKNYFRPPKMDGTAMQSATDSDELLNRVSSGELFLTNLTRSPSPIQELGHQSLHPTWTEFARAACRGLILGLTLNGSLRSTGRLDLAIPFSMAMDTMLSDYSKEISYDHEYAREVWEHEYNSMGEIEEYVEYATARGIAQDKARDIALSVTSEPNVSVPYHLAFELGLIRPTSYERKLEHASAVGLGYYAGICGSKLAQSLSRNISERFSATSYSKTALIPISLLLLSPALFLRFRHILSVNGSLNFKLLTLSAYTLSLAMVVYFTRSPYSNVFSHFSTSFIRTLGVREL